MGKTTGVRWCDSTWNPWYGCKKVSPGCAHCYAERDMTKYDRDFNAVTRAKDPTFYAPLKKWKEGVRIFTCSWSDFFIEEADNFWRPDAWKVIRQTPQHIYMILTKRPERMMNGASIARLPWSRNETPWPNVWLGVSAENQATADERIPILLNTPAALRFVSLEPLLGPINLRPLPDFSDKGDGPAWLGRDDGSAAHRRGLDWVIAGGESGPEARPIDPVHVRAIRDHCVELDVPFFFKQWSDPGLQEKGILLDDKEWSQIPFSCMSICVKCYEKCQSFSRHRFAHVCSKGHPW